MIDPVRFIKANFILEHGKILMFDVPASRFREFNELYGTSFQGTEGTIRVNIPIADFISQYKDVFRDVTEKHKKSDVLAKLLSYDERKGIGHAPFFRFKIMESLKARKPKVIKSKAVSVTGKSLIFY